MIESCKSPILDLYYLATLPQRQIAASQRLKQGQVPVIVLFYHRVADQHPNDWTISTTRFREEIEWVRKRFDIVTLEEAQNRIREGSNTRPTACITFDDGYGDNYQTAIPWLLGETIPFTYFVSTEFVKRQQPFPHDVEAGVPLEPNTIEQLREMASRGVEIGAHTRTHVNVGELDSHKQILEEVVGSKHDLEDILHREVRYFAFPYGLPQNMSRAAFRIAYEAGFRGICSAYGGYNLPGDDSFHLRRIHGDPIWARFRNWMTITPRKLYTGYQFDPGDYRSGGSNH